MNIQLQNIYTLNGMYRAIDIYNNPKKFTHTQFTLAFRYLMEFSHLYPYSNIPKKDNLINNLLHIFFETMPNDIYNMEVFQDLLDFIIHYIPEETDRAIDRMNYIENILNPQPIINTINLSDKNRKTVYDDSQNVHNSEINQEVLRISSYLIDSWHPMHYGVLGDWKFDTFSWKFPRKCNQAISRIGCDSTKFTYKNKTFKLRNVLEALWFYINSIYDNDTKKIIKRIKWQNELTVRLEEELVEMAHLCATGHLARMVNVLQGFSEDEPQFELKMSDVSQYKNVIRAFLNKKLQECSDDNVINGMMKLNDIFKNYIRNIIENKKNEWNKDYTVLRCFCGEFPEFGNSDNNDPTFCLKHKEDDMTKIPTHFEKHYKLIVNQYCQCEVYENDL
jgi:hypothetical protein